MLKMMNNKNEGLRKAAIILSVAVIFTSCYIGLISTFANAQVLLTPITFEELVVGTGYKNITGTTISAEGSNKYLSFNSTTNNQAFISESLPSADNGIITLDFKYKPAAESERINVSLIGKDSNDTSNFHYVSSQINMGYLGSTVSGSTFYSPFNQNKFYHVQYEINADNYTFNVYVDGEKITYYPYEFRHKWNLNSALSGDYPITGRVKFNQLAIASSNPAYQSSFKGNLDDITVYSGTRNTGGTAAGAVMTEDFNSCTTGQMNGQNSWYCPSALETGCTVTSENNVAGATGNVMKLTSAAGSSARSANISRNMPAQTGVFKIRYKYFVPSTSSKSIYVRFYDVGTAWPYATAVYGGKTSVSSYVASGTAPTIFVGQDAWHWVEIEVDVPGQRYRFNVDGSSYSAYATFRQTVSKIDRIEIADDNSAAAGNVYIDDLYVYDPAIHVPPAVGTTGDAAEALSRIALLEKKLDELMASGAGTPGTISPSYSVGPFTIPGTTGSSFDVVLTASNFSDFSPKTFTVLFNASEVSVQDLCLETAEAETSQCNVNNMVFSVVEPGKIEFSINNPVQNGNQWSGAVNVIRFTSKINGNATFSYTVR